MKVAIDSSAWIEYFAGSQKGDALSASVQGKSGFIVPTLVLFEVYRKLKRSLSEEEAISAVTQMQQGEVVELDGEIALFAADLSLQHKLAMADAIIYATAQIQ